MELVREFQLHRDAAQAIVPDGMVWAIDGHDVAEGRVTTSDVHIDGRASIGDFDLEGSYWLTFQKAQSQIVWAYEKTKVGLGDTRPTLNVKEFRHTTGH